MTFNHPLARAAAVWATGGLKDKSRHMLVIVTTLDLDPTSKKFKADKVDRLSGAAKEWLKENTSEASDFMLINRARDW